MLFVNRDWRLFNCVHDCAADNCCTEMEANPGEFPDAGPMPHPCVYREGHVTDLGNGEFTAKMFKPPTGWTAFFIDVQFAGGRSTGGVVNRMPGCHFTSEVAIVPDTMPFGKCAPFGSAHCTRRLV